MGARLRSELQRRQRRHMGQYKHHPKITHHATAVTTDDRKFMNMALDLAMRAYGKTHPNPHVGCVIVRDGKVRRRLGQRGASWWRLRGAATSVGWPPNHPQIQPNP